MKGMLARWGGLAIVAGSVLPYLPSLQYGFVNYDDGSSILALPLIRMLSLESLPRFFVPDIYAGLPEYMPLKNLSYAIDVALFGFSAAAFRPQQLLWYAVSVGLVYVWLRALLSRLAELGRLGVSSAHAPWIAFVASALFVVHPVHVESVVWLSGRKDVLCGAFMSAALYAGLQFSLQERARWAFAALGCGVLALASKPTAVALAPLWLVQAFWVAPAAAGRQYVRKQLGLLAPASLLALAWSVGYSRFVAAFGRTGDAPPGSLELAPWVRIGQQLARNLELALAPHALTPIVPDTLFDADPLSARAVAGFAVAFALAALFAAGVRRRTLLALAVALFVVPLLPSLLRPVWGQYVAGRYLYHAVLGPCVGLTWLVAFVVERAPRLRPLGWAAVGGIAALWTGATLDYGRSFRDSSAMWARSIAVHPTFARFYDLAAQAALARGDRASYLALLERCLERAPQAPECAVPLGGVLLALDPARGEAMLRAQLARDPTGSAHQRLAQHWARSGKPREALAFYERYLDGRNVGPNAIRVVMELAAAAGEAEKVKGYLRQYLVAAARYAPASPPPSAAVLGTLDAAGDAALAAAARDAAARCTRTDCFAEALGEVR